MTRQWVDRFLVTLAMPLVFGATGASAQVDPVEVYPLPGQQNWNAIFGAADMDGDPADEIVVIRADAQLVIVDSATGEIQFDSGPYDWNHILVPGWTREGSSDYHRSHGYGIFCDEDGDGIYCVNLLVSDVSEYEEGSHTVVWDGKDEAGHTVAAGMYFYELRTGAQRTARKALLLR